MKLHVEETKSEGRKVSLIYRATVSRGLHENSVMSPVQFIGSKISIQKGEFSKMLTFLKIFSEVLTFLKILNFTIQIGPRHQNILKSTHFFLLVLI